MRSVMHRSEMRKRMRLRARLAGLCSSETFKLSVVGLSEGATAIAALLTSTDGRTLNRKDNTFRRSYVHESNKMTDIQDRGERATSPKIHMVL